MLFISFGRNLHNHSTTHTIGLRISQEVARAKRAHIHLTTKMDNPCAEQHISSIRNSLQALPRSVKLCIEFIPIVPKFPATWTVLGTGGDIGSSSLSMMTMASRESTSWRLRVFIFVFRVFMKMGRWGGVFWMVRFGRSLVHKYVSLEVPRGPDVHLPGLGFSRRG